MINCKHPWGIRANWLALPLTVALLLFMLPAELGKTVKPTGPDEISERLANAATQQEMFSRFHYEIRASEDGSIQYPMGYQMREYNKSITALKHAGSKLNWIERGPGNVAGRTRSVVVDTDDPNNRSWFAGTAGGGLWQTTTGGNTWIPLTDHLPTLSVSTIALAESNHDILYLGTGEGFGNYGAIGGVGVFKSYDRGQSWLHLASTSTDERFRFVNRLVVDPGNADLVVAATNEGLYRTIDGGVSWTEVYRSGRVQDLKAQPGNFDILIASVNSVGIIRSTDGGETWTQVLAAREIIGGGRRLELAFAPSDPNVAYAAVETTLDDNSELLYSEDGGATWMNTFEDHSYPANWLYEDGWNNNAIGVHPFRPNQLFLGGHYLWEARISGARTGTFTGPSSFNMYVPSSEEWSVSYARGLGGYFNWALLSGLDPRYSSVFTDIEEGDFVAVEIRLGQGTQMAHRFTIPYDTYYSGTGCFNLPYEHNYYQDYVEVPFTVWDIDNNQQLAVSFRDQGRDSTFNLVGFNQEGPCADVSNEQLFVHKYPYSATAPHDSVAQVAGVTKGLLYMVLPFMRIDHAWDPDRPPVQTTTIGYLRVAGFPERKMELPNRAGQTQESVPHYGHHSIVPIPIDANTGDYWLLNSNDGGVALSKDGGQSFAEFDGAGRGFNTSMFYGVDKRPGASQYIGGTQNNGSYMSRENPTNRDSWRLIFSGVGFDAIWHPRDPEKLLVTRSWNSYSATTDGGGYWGNTFTPDDWGNWLTAVSISPHAPDTVYSIGTLGVWRSTEFAAYKTWQLTPIDSAWTPTLAGMVSASLATDSVVWAGYGLDDQPEQTLYVSTDAGQSFSPAALPAIRNAPRTALSGLATHPTEVGTAYALFSRYQRPKILETKDFGQTWSDLSGFSESINGSSTTGFPDVAVHDLLVMPHAPNVIWVGTEVGLFQTTNYGQEWNYADNGLPATAVWRLKLRDDEIVIATHGRGVWTVPWGEIATGVVDDIAEDLPSEFTLAQNYPNPFNATTTIGFSVPMESRIRLTLFDVTGRQLSVLTDKTYPAGFHDISFNADAYSSGVYFYRMESDGSLLQARKMMLVK